MAAPGAAALASVDGGAAAAAAAGERQLAAEAAGDSKEEERLKEDEEEVFWICRDCGQELPDRRREAHQRNWCPALAHRLADEADDDDDGGGSSASSSCCGGGFGAGLVGGLRQRGPGRRSGADGAPGCSSSCGFGGGCRVGDCSGDDIELHFPDPLADTPESALRRGRLSFFFLVLMVAPALAAGYLLLQEHLRPMVLHVEPTDSSTVSSIFFDGGSWVVRCVNPRTAKPGKPPEALKKAAERLLPEGVRTAEVHCWAPLPTKKGPRTLAQRFRFRDKPPVVMFVDGGRPPQLLDTTSSTAASLVKQVKRALREDPGGDQERPDSQRRAPTDGAGGGRDRRERVGRRPRHDDGEEAAGDDGSEQQRNKEDEEEVDVVNL